jgi:filamentous hemagglutinin
VNGLGTINIGKLDNLPPNVQNAYKGYEGNGWQGNYSGQALGTNAGRAWKNDLNDLPSVNSAGDSITYKEFDVNNRISGAARDSERFLAGSDGSIYYTADHYATFIKIG